MTEAATAAAQPGFRDSMSRAAGHVADAGRAGWGNVKSGLASADASLNAAKAAHGGTLWGAIKGVSAKHPVTAFVAGTAALATTVYLGSKVFGKHTDRVERERAQASSVQR